MPDKNYTVVRDYPNGPPLALIRGAGERYDGAGGWVVDGSVIRYYGLGGDSYELDEVSDDELPGIMAIIDARFAGPPAGRPIAAVGLMADPIRVLIVDDHPIYRDGMRRLIDRSPDLEL